MLAVSIALLARMIVERDTESPTIRLVLMLFVLIGVGVTVRPKYCSVQLSLRAIDDLKRGGPPERVPIGYGPEENPDEQVPYDWPDYRDTLRYLRDQTPATAKVANLLRVPPALAGPANRASALPAESLAWLVVAPQEEPRFLEAIEAGGRDTLVVWSPAEEGDRDILRLAPVVKRLAPTIRRLYELRARFGRIEVWSRKNDAPTP